jgi:hypothetical protein
MLPFYLKIAPLFMVLAGVVTGFYLTTLIRNKISSLKN